MPIRQKIVAVIIAVSIFVIIVELVRRRKLKEEYSWLWLLTGFGIFILTFRYELLVNISQLIGAVVATSTLFFFALMFLILICLQFSVSITKLEDRTKNLAQELAILKNRIGEELEKKCQK